MALTKIQFSPGVDKEGTEYTADAGWFDSDKIRFRQGRPEKIGGWQKYSDSSFLGVCRSIFDWASLESIKYIGLVTDTAEMTPMFTDLLAEMCMVHHQTLDPGAGQRLHMTFDQALAAGSEQRLRCAVGQRPHSLAAAGGKNQGIHQPAPRSRSSSS